MKTEKVTENLKIFSFAKLTISVYATKESPSTFCVRGLSFGWLLLIYYIGVLLFYSFSSRFAGSMTTVRQLLSLSNTFLQKS